MGLENNKVKLENNYIKWQKLFEIEKNNLKNIFKNIALNIEHIGSTSIKNLPSKPIIDITIGVNNFDDVLNVNIPKEYEIKVQLEKEEILLIKENNNKTEFLIHIMLLNSKRYNDTIKFRDILRTNKKVLFEYTNLKKDLANKYYDNRKKYTESKNEFIKNILKEEI